MNHLLVVTAGMGSPSSSRLLGDRLAGATVAALARPLAGPAAPPLAGPSSGGPTPEVRVLELRDLAVDLASYYANHVPSERLRDAFGLVGTVSGVIAVTPVLNAGPSGLFKLFFDLLDEGVMSGRPVLLAATGGTARHSLAIDQAMLPMFFYLKALVAPTPVFAATDDWGSADAGLARRIERAASDFAELIRTRPASDYADEFASVPDFASLLAG